MDTQRDTARFGIIGIASLSPEVELGNPKKNVANILELLGNKEVEEADIVALPELSISGYSCGDLFFQTSLIRSCAESLGELAERLKEDARLIAVGLPIVREGKLYNCGAFILGGKILGIVPKIHIPNYQEFYEKRWFESGEGIDCEEFEIAGQKTLFGTNILVEYMGAKTGLEICEDLWVPTPPSSRLCQGGADVILNLSATDDNIGKYSYIKKLVASQSARCRCAYAYASAGSGESSTDLVFSGINLIAYDGEIIKESERFSRGAKMAVAHVDIEKLKSDRRKYSTFYDGIGSETIKTVKAEGPSSETVRQIRIEVNPHPFIPGDERSKRETCKEIVSIQTWGLAQRLKATGCRHLVVGISGGLDSTLALLVAHHTFETLGFDVKGIVGVTMPSKATSERTHSNAIELMELLGVTKLEIPIYEAVRQHFEAIGHDENCYDAVYENSQARERTQILMDLANKYNGMVLGTGDMSELALGWCTYNGDQMSMYNVNGGVPKTLVKYLVGWFAETAPSEKLAKVINDIIATPISPELIPARTKDEISQKTEDIVGPYELHDFFLYHVIRNGFSPTKIMYIAESAFEKKYSREELKKWLINFYRRFFSQQFKRSCMPDGPKIGSVCLSPRGDWRMPSDATASIWLEEARRL